MIDALFFESSPAIAKVTPTSRSDMVERTSSDLPVRFVVKKKAKKFPRTSKMAGSSFRSGAAKIVLRLGITGWSLQRLAGNGLGRAWIGTFRQFDDF